MKPDAMPDKSRCPWATRKAINTAYHDTEWGVPSHDDRHLFEMLILEGAQAGLSWETVLTKREHYREALEHFDPAKIARYTQSDVEKLMTNPGLIRNRLKLQSTIQNAKAFLAIQEAFGSFDAYLWQFTKGPVVNHWKTMDQVPAKNLLSDTLSKDLKRRGFNFVGSTICYSYLQAVGVVNDHLVSCFRHRELL